MVPLSVFISLFLHKCSGRKETQLSLFSNEINKKSFVVECNIYISCPFAVRIGFLYVISGFGGSLLSSLFIQTGISVGASGALFGLLGGMLSELFINWTIYANKVNELKKCVQFNSAS